ncbi:MAG: 4Fe-4S dicluster domain-containing protein [Desulfotignum sp.]
MTGAGISKPVTGYEVSVCSGSKGCPHVACPTAGLAGDLTRLLEQADIPGFLKTSLGENIKPHHVFRITLSDCPNACSHPQIADIGIIGAMVPGVGDNICTGGNACVQACPDQAVRLTDTPEGDKKPVIDGNRCQRCGKCVHVCPSRILEPVQSGFRVLLGGRLGRHPRLALEIPGLHSREQVLATVESCLKYYKTHSRNGKRFSHLFTGIDQVIPKNRS